MEFDISRLRNAFGGGSQNPYENRTPPYFPEETPGPSPTQSLNSAFAGPGSASLYPNSYLNTGEQPRPQEPADQTRMRAIADEVYAPQPQITWGGSPNPPGQPVDINRASMAQEAPSIAPPAQIAPWSPPETGQIPMGEQVPIQDNMPPRTGRKTPAQDEFMRAIREMPQLNKPGVLRRIAAAALGGATMEPRNTEAILHKPYYDAMMPWSARMPYLQQAANIERQSLTAEDNDWNRYLANEFKFQNLERQVKEGQQKIGISQQVADTGRFKAESTAFQQNRRNDIAEKALKGVHRIIFSKDGSAVLARKDGTFEELDPALLEGYTLEEKIRLQSAGALKLVEARGDIQAAIEEFKAGARLDLEEAKSKDGATPNEIKQGKINRGQDIKRIKPEYAQFVKINPQSGDIKVEVPEAGMFSGGYSTKRRAEVIAEINAWIDNGTPFPTPGTVTQSTTTVTPPATPPRKVNLPGRTTAPTTPSTGQPQRSKGANPPAIEQRKVGQEHEWPNGNVGRWTGTKWEIIQLKAK